MRILAIADEEQADLWRGDVAGRFSNVDLILSAGDLDADYLEFLVTIVNRPLLYVHGNHDESYVRHPPRGCICIDGAAYVYRGVRIAGLGGSRRYREGTYMYTERQMRRRAKRVSRSIRALGGVDILLTHAPARGLGDMDDIPHQGFDCFNELLDRWNPGYMVHGHVHESYLHDFLRERQASGGTRVVNAFGYTQFDIQPAAGSYGWRQALVNRRTLKASDELGAQEEGLLGAGWSYGAWR